MRFHRTRKYSYRFWVGCFFVLGIFWIQNLTFKAINKPPTRFEVIQEQVEQYIERQQNLVPLTTKEGIRK